MAMTMAVAMTMAMVLVTAMAIPWQCVMYMVQSIAYMVYNMHIDFGTYCIQYMAITAATASSHSIL